MHLLMTGMLLQFFLIVTISSQMDPEGYTFLNGMADMIHMKVIP